MITYDMRPVLRHQELGRLFWQKGPRQAVAQITHRVDAAIAQVRSDGLERHQISMYV
jgi:hypothetical protein